MQLLINQSVIDLTLNAIHESIADKVAGKSKSQRDQGMATDVLGFFALQVLIPILVSICSSALYDVLKGRVLSKLRRKELEFIVIDFCGKTGNTSGSMSGECMQSLSNQLAPLGFTEFEIVTMYEKIRIVVESNQKNESTYRDVQKK